jgi:hypothetical protein
VRAHAAAPDRDGVVSSVVCAQVLDAFPTGSAMYSAKKPPQLSDPKSAESQRLLNFVKSTDFVLWEVKTKVTIIKRYVLIAESWSKLLAVGTLPHTLTHTRAHTLARTRVHTCN